MKRYILTRSAQNDITSIHHFIFQHNPDAADNVASEIRASIRLIADHPGIGHVRDEIGDDSIRFWPVFSFLIVYRIDTAPLHILRVLHGAQDIPTVLENPG